MKKRILLSMVSFFVMATSWASLLEAYQIYVTGANAKTNGTAELTLNMKNRNAINMWECTLVLPEGVTFQSATLITARIPDGFNAEFSAVDNGDGTVSFTCEGEVGVGIPGTDGAIATVTVAIGDITPGDVIVTVKDTKLTEPNGTINEDKKGQREFTWTLEQGEQQGVEGDLNGDGKVDIADAVAVLEVMARDGSDEWADLNKDGKVDIADFVAVLEIMAKQ